MIVDNDSPPSDIIINDRTIDRLSSSCPVVTDSIMISGGVKSIAGSRTSGRNSSSESDCQSSTSSMSDSSLSSISDSSSSSNNGLDGLRRNRRGFVAQFVIRPPRSLDENQFLRLKSYTVGRWTVCGAIKVRRFDAEKRVYVRYTLDDWSTSSEIESRYLNTEQSIDLFHFRLYFPFRLKLGTKLQFVVACVLFTGCATTHWDNNDGINYSFVYSM